LIGGILGTKLPVRTGVLKLFAVGFAESDKPRFPLAGFTPPVNPPEPPIDAPFADLAAGSGVWFEPGVLLAFPAALPGLADSSVAPPVGAGVRRVAAAGALCAFEGRPPEGGACGSNIEGAVGRGEAAPAVGVSLKLILNALSPQGISPPVRMNDKLLEGVELQLPPGI
jgi:hypothetical protein